MENINQLKQAISKLDEREVKSFLHLMFLRLEQCEEREVKETLQAMKESLIQTSSREENNGYETVHIIFGGSAGGSLKAAFRKKPYKKTEEVIVVPGVLSVGPVESLHTEQGVRNRIQWQSQHFHSFPGDFEQEEQELLKALKQVKAIPPTQPIIVWTGENAAEQTGLRIVMYLLRNKPNDLSEMNTNKAFHDIHVYQEQKTEYYYRHSGEMAPEQLLELYEQYKLRPLKPTKRRALQEEGNHVLLLEDVLRTWEHGELWGLNSDRHDDFIIKCAKRLHKEQTEPDFMPAARVIGEVLGHIEQYTGDEWLEYRLRELIGKEVFSYQGDLHEMWRYQVKLNNKYMH
ncbi:DUF1835 domain-containing protein [Sporosarcina cascadiensis]|uniref:DUF1835 domain-containing protein n=1 Tax=Sporosarcina cascadiensis TaxID=2660747 RepID=UPI001E5D5BA1|nr:DUF1835 domain-containing protein [Sporosarcina cascadiensis]